MTTAHDTAAALEAAIDAHGANASGARTALHRAITAHVEAEVARRLAAAPEVEAAIGAYANAGRGGVTTRKDLDDVRTAWQNALAAIAADKARAVEAARPTPATSPAMVEAYKAGCEREATRRRSDGDYSYRPEVIIAAGLAAALDAARPTPDEARRLVNALVQACQTLPDDEEYATARTALLRALGGEA